MAILVIAFILVTAIYLLGLTRSKAVIMHKHIPAAAALQFPSAANFRQGPNQCGPYSAAAFAHALTGKPALPEDMVKQLPWKLPRGYTHPKALESLLSKQDVQMEAFNVGSLSDEEKKIFLREQLSMKKPVILLVHMYGYQHYIVLLGYDSSKDIFHVYDPVFTRGETGMTVDENGDSAGNRDIEWQQLLAPWSEGGIAGFYTWYALTGMI